MENVVAASAAAAAMTAARLRASPEEAADAVAAAVRAAWRRPSCTTRVFALDRDDALAEPESESAGADVVQEDLAEAEEDARQDTAEDTAEVLQAIARVLRGIALVVKGCPGLGRRFRSDHGVERALCEVGVRLRNLLLALGVECKEDGFLDGNPVGFVNEPELDAQELAAHLSVAPWRGDASSTASPAVCSEVDAQVSDAVPSWLPGTMARRALTSSEEVPVAPAPTGAALVVEIAVADLPKPPEASWELDAEVPVSHLSVAPRRGDASSTASVEVCSELHTSYDT